MFDKYPGPSDTGKQNKDVGILGLSFKPNTNSVAGSASVQLAQNLLSKARASEPTIRSHSRKRGCN